MASPLVVIGVPTYGQVHINWALARAHLQLPLGASSADFIVSGKDIATARNEIAERAIKIGAKYLFFIDDDVIVPPHAFLSLSNRKKPLVTGVYWSKTVPPQPMIWRDYMQGPYYDWHVGEFIKLDWGACGCLLIDVKEVFTKIKKPFFSVDYLFSKSQEFVSSRSTEDLFFFSKTKQAGIELWCDTSVQCMHVDRNSGTAYGLPPDWPQANPKSKIKLDGNGKKVADIGAGFAQPWFDGAQVVRYDIDERCKPDVRCDVRKIPEKDCIFDIVHARHVLEHFEAKEIPSILSEWLRILKVGGELQLNVPNIHEACKSIVEERATEYTYWQLYGEQKDKNDFHKTGFTPKSMKRLLDQFECLRDIEIVCKDGNIIAKAKKVEHKEKYIIEDNLMGYVHEQGKDNR